MDHLVTLLFWGSLALVAWGSLLAMGQAFADWRRREQMLRGEHGSRAPVERRRRARPTRAEPQA